MLNLHNALNTKNASLTNSSSVGIGRPIASKFPSPSTIAAPGKGPPLGSGVSSASPLGTGMEMVEEGMWGVPDMAGETSALIGAGAVGI